MPVIHIHLLEGRSEEKKEHLIENVTATVCETLGVKNESVRIILQEMPPAHFGIAGQSVKRRSIGEGENK